jgi:transposase
VLWERSVVEQRYDAVMEVVRDGLPVTVVAERYGVARQSVHGWLRRYRDGGLEGLTDRSHRRVSCPHQMPAAVEARVCELRRAHPGWGRSGCATSSPERAWRRCRRGQGCIGRWSATASSSQGCAAAGGTIAAGSGTGRCSCGRWT